MMKRARRLDAHLAEAGLSKSRESAKKEILAGWVTVNGETKRVPSTLIAGSEEIVVSRPGGQFVSRGGDKLQYGLNHFAIDPSGKCAADLGASTGGFTDCLLQNGARMVYAIDVGYGQFDYTLRNDPRVVLMERTNVRALTAGSFRDAIDLMVADLSFISLTKIIGIVREIISPAEALLLVKPQFEAVKAEQKKGVVKGASVHSVILARFLRASIAEGLEALGMVHSPLKGPAGNMEFFLHCRFREAGAAVDEISIDSMVSGAVTAAYEYFSTDFKK